MCLVKIQRFPSQSLCYILVYSRSLFSPRKEICFLWAPTSGYRKLSSTSGVPEEPNRASLSLVSSSRSSSGRVSAVSWDMESVSSPTTTELKVKKNHSQVHTVHLITKSYTDGSFWGVVLDEVFQHELVHKKVHKNHQNIYWWYKSPRC